LLVTVPAHQWLFSDFDLSIGHYRRYSRKFLLDSLSRVGFSNSKARFLFSLFVLPALILRKLPTLFGRANNLKETTKASERQTRLLKVMQPLVITILYLESFIRLPFGLSLFSVSKK
jgi:hypothetical protein